MKKQWRIIAIALIVLTLGSVPVYGQDQFGMGGAGRAMEDGPGTVLPLLLRGVKLTDEQRTQVQKIMSSHRPTFEKLFKQLREVQEEMSNKLLASGKIQEQDLAPQVQKMVQLRSQLAQEGLKSVLEVRAILTPEQLAKAAKLKQRMDALRAEMKSLFEESR